MLKKLFKYDWKTFYKIPATINLFLIIVTLIGIISIASPFWTLEYEIMDVLMVMSILFYYLTIFAGSIGVSVYTAVRFYKNIYTDEGYLTNTLPVTPRQIILSKLFVSTIWNFITGFTVCISVFSLIYTAMLSYEHVNIFKDVFPSFNSFVQEFSAELGMNFYGCLIYLLILSIVSTLFSIIMIFSAISLGQLFKQHKVAGAVIWYIAEYIITQTSISLFINLPIALDIPLSQDLLPGAIIRPFVYGGTLLTVIVGIILYFITEYMLKKKLNLE